MCSSDLFARILGNRAELVVHIGDFALGVCDRNDSVFIKCRFEFGKFDRRTLWKAAFHILAPRTRSALAMTDTELKLIAASASDFAKGWQRGIKCEARTAV